jgi:hypothetical protein
MGTGSNCIALYGVDRSFPDYGAIDLAQPTGALAVGPLTGMRTLRLLSGEHAAEA